MARTKLIIAWMLKLSYIYIIDIIVSFFKSNIAWDSKYSYFQRLAFTSRHPVWNSKTVLGPVNIASASDIKTTTGAFIITKDIQWSE